MPSFKHRSYQKELLDRNDIPFEDIKTNMRELDMINHRLGGHKITTAGFSKLARRYANTNEILEVIEMGCGGGDNLRTIRKWAMENKIEVKLSGIDINYECIAYAQEHPGNKGIHFIHSDYRDATFDQKPHIVFSSLFCHHFDDEELVLMLKWMQQNSRLGFFINDLHRHPLAYYSIKLLTSVFSKSYLVKNDAPVSVQRGFKRKDWEALFWTARVEHDSCEWHWAFRWLIISTNK